MSVHEFPRDGERFWRSFEPATRTWLLTQMDAGTADKVLASIAPVVRRVGDQARAVIKIDADFAKNVDAWLREVIGGLLHAIVAREYELVSLRAECDDLRAQLQAPHAA